MRGYLGVNLPQELVVMIRETIEQHPEWGYKTVAEFVKESARRQLLEIKKPK